MGTTAVLETAFMRLLKLAFWIPLALITAAALAPKGPPMPFAVSDIVLHAGAFTYLTAALGFAHFEPGRRLNVALWMFGYGLGIEAIQYFIPERSAELKDLFVDGIGIGLGLWVWQSLAGYAGQHLEAWRSR
jgi:VanZ family protein